MAVSLEELQEISLPPRGVDRKDNIVEREYTNSASLRSAFSSSICGGRAFSLPGCGGKSAGGGAGKAAVLRKSEKCENMIDRVNRM